MKNIFKSLIAAVLITGFASCEDEQDLIYVNPPAATFSIITPQTGESVFLDPAQPDNPGLVITWEDVDYGTPTEITYTVQVAQTGTDFASPVDVVSTTNTFATITSEALNGAANAAGLEPFVQGALDVRIKSTVGTNGSEPAYSNVIAYLVTPYVTYPFKDLFLIGNATATGWDNTGSENHYAMYRSPEDENIYNYTGYFAVGQFKLLRKKGQWAPQYGTDGTNLVYRPTEAEPDPANFQVTTAGYYTLTVNTEALTYSFTAYTGSTTTTYPTIGIIGTATPGGWDNDTDMTQSTFDPHIWYMRNQFLVAGADSKLKFRANNGWDTNWGDDSSYSGVGTQGGPDIPIGITSNGNYDIWFNDLTGEYIYIPAE